MLACVSFYVVQGCKNLLVPQLEGTLASVGVNVVFSCVVFVSEVFKKDLEKDVAGDTSGNFAKLLLALVQVA